MKIEKAVAGALLVGSLLMPVTAFAATPTPSPKAKVMSEAAKTKLAARRVAQKAYNDAVKTTNQDYKAARDSARKAFQDAMKAAGKDKTLRTKAQQDYQAALKAAREKMQTDKKQALDTYKAAVK